MVGLRGLQTWDQRANQPSGSGVRRGGYPHQYGLYKKSRPAYQDCSCMLNGYTFIALQQFPQLQFIKRLEIG